MIVNRDTQVITSKYGKRNGFLRKHRGIDLRSFDDNWKRVEILLPDECIFLRSVYQEKWGWTHVFETMSGIVLKFTHMRENNEFEVDKNYDKGHCVGYTALTDYMKKKKYGEHLHFETWRPDGHFDPEFYLKREEIRYDYK